MPDEALQRASELNRIVLVNRADAGPDQRRGGLRLRHPPDRGPPGLARDTARFVFLGGPPESWSGARRWAGLRDAAAEHGLEATRFGPYVPHHGVRPGRGRRRRSPPARRRSSPTTTCWRSGCCSASPSAACACPGSVSVVGFDDIFGADFCPPPLTTLAERTAEAGTRAVEALAALTRPGARPATEDAPVRVLPTHLVVRASSGPAPG